MAITYPYVAVTYDHREPLMPNKTLSIRDDDLRIWERASAAAEAARMTLSAYVTTALVEKMDDIETISVLVSEPKLHYEQFEGRWLVQPYDPDLLMGKGDGDVPDSWVVGVAETARGKLALYLGHWTSAANSELRVYDTADELCADVQGDPRVSDDVLHAAKYSRSSGKRPVVWRDI